MKERSYEEAKEYLDRALKNSVLKRVRVWTKLELYALEELIAH